MHNEMITLVTTIKKRNKRGFEETAEVVKKEIFAGIRSAGVIEKSALRCHSAACSGVIPRNSASIVLFSRKPSPTIFVRFVLIADTASGADINKLLDLCRNTGMFLSISSCGVLLDASQPRIEFLFRAAPDSS